MRIFAYRAYARRFRWASYEASIPWVVLRGPGPRYRQIVRRSR